MKFLLITACKSSFLNDFIFYIIIYIISVLKLSPCISKVDSRLNILLYLFSLVTAGPSLYYRMEFLNVAEKQIRFSVCLLFITFKQR